MRPGARQFTVTPCGPSSRASDFAYPVTPGRMVFDSARCSVGSFAALDVKTRMRPPSLWTRCGRQSSTRRTSGASRSSTASSTLSGVIAVAGPGGGPPLFQTRMSSPPNASTVRWTVAVRSRGLLTSPRTASAPMRSASRSSTSRRRANIVTFAPSPASASAVASPRPDDAPLTIAVRPLSPRSIFYLLTEHADDFAHRVGRFLQLCLLVFRQLELDDLLDAGGAELHRHAHVETVDAVLALQKGRAGQDA